MGALDSTTLADCLPPKLRGPATTITRLGAGLSSAGVYRVESAGGTFVLKITNAHEPLAAWRQTIHFRQLAAQAGVAPRIIHVDEGRRAVVSAFVVDRSFPRFYRDPRTHEAALGQLGRTLRRVHELPLPSGAVADDERALLASFWSELDGKFPLPAFVSEAVRPLRLEPAPAREGAMVVSHNDVNPSNLVYDGENILLLDWEAVAPNDALYDLAAIAVFLRMDEPTCRRLLAAHDGAPVAVLPPRFNYNRRLVAALCGTAILNLARKAGHAGAAGGETLDSTLSLGAVYQQMGAGALNLATAEGQWCFGLALVKESVALQTA